jgi:hypothetical protein
MPFPILSPFAEVALLLVMATAIGLFGILMRQPLITRGLLHRTPNSRSCM